MQNQSPQNDSQPQNAVESALLDAKAGHVPLDTFLRKLIASDLYIASTREAGEDGRAFMPLLFDRDGVPMAAVFTTLSRAALHRDRAPFSLQMNGLELFTRMPPDYGIVINPGHPVRLEIQPHGVKEIVQELGNTRGPATQRQPSMLRV